eukprot:Blabericola_migrator_1__9992@NODE_552_length_7652_cov_40_220040_g145_i2_p3_GENE_NODE_552_length_7652_cov_40_220040_g145_i2NODE_552_length_7652_cov_40_220040_g145_i2_p3_ORF_typecomplete_len191_score51_29DUF2040/PF09745_9/1_2e03DUF2040/PF09745_9/1_5e11DUF1087/PF06465_13/0_21DUF1087/PF06465_13/6_2e02_NODE_552_length_7652_cov_40_220040_g145_i243984970
MSFAIKLKPAKAKAAPKTVAALFKRDEDEEPAPSLYSFKPKAPSIPSSLLKPTAGQLTTEEDDQVIQAAIKDFDQEDEAEALHKQKRQRLQETDEAALYEGGKFKMSKVDSVKAGLIIMKDKSQEDLKPKYVTKLLKSATLRDAEREIIHEAKIVKEIEQEVGDKPVTAYVTSGYKRRLQERQACYSLCN